VDRVINPPVAAQRNRRIFRSPDDTSAGAVPLQAAK
jgi:hypothetical protein